MSSPSVVVIGGGAAGMLAALQLRGAGVDVTLLEAAPRLGGVIHTIVRDGWIAEAGPNSLAEPESGIRALLNRAGVDAVTVRVDRAHTRRYLVHDAGLVPVPRSVGELLAWPVLSAAGRMRLLKEPFVKPSANSDETVDAFVRRRLGDEMATRVFDPLVSGACAGDSTQVLMRHTFPKMVEWERSGGSLLKGSVRAGIEARRRAGRAGGAGAGNWSCTGGLGVLPRLVARHLGSSVLTGATVREIVPQHQGFDVLAGDGNRARFDGVICAVPAQAFSMLRFGLRETAALDAMAAVPHASLATVSLGYRREDVEHPLDGHGVLAPSAENRAVLGIFFASSAFSDRAPEGHVLMTAFVGGMRRPDRAALGNTAMIEMVQDEMRALLGVRGAPRFAEVNAWPSCQPQAIAGHGPRLEALSSLEAEVPGLVFAGAWRDGLSLADAMRSGRSAAQRLMEQQGWVSAG